VFRYLQWERQRTDAIKSNRLAPGEASRIKPKQLIIPALPIGKSKQPGCLRDKTNV
jgi:hypothetical protein